MSLVGTPSVPNFGSGLLDLSTHRHGHALFFITAQGQERRDAFWLECFFGVKSECAKAIGIRQQDRIGENKVCNHTGRELDATPG